MNKYLEDKNIVALYRFGSVVYKTTDENSDEDFVCVVKEKTKELELSFPDNLYTVSEFEKKIDEHHFMAIECLFLPKSEIIKYHDWGTIKIDKHKLRCSVSAIASNAYVKCKKKLAQGDIRVGMKSFWHSFRIVLMASELAEFGKITFDAHYELWKAIMNEKPDFIAMNEKYKPLYNETLSKFRILCPKIV